LIFLSLAPQDSAQFNMSCTHKVGVAAVIVRDATVLMLQRTNPPLIWAPPGGRLEPGEDPILGLKREVMEECGLVIDALRPISIYQGTHEGETLLGISIVCRYVGGDLLLSNENSAFEWIDPFQYQRGPFQIGNIPVLGTQEDYALAVAIASSPLMEIP
jgi:8-oxo-dGTP diphosphatase